MDVIFDTTCVHQHLEDTHNPVKQFVEAASCYTLLPLSPPTTHCLSAKNQIITSQWVYTLGLANDCLNTDDEYCQLFSLNFQDCVIHF